MNEHFAKYFEENPDLAFRALGSGVNAPALDLEPFGRVADFLDAAKSARWIEHYHASNRAAFTGPLSLPGWVLVDLYLMPAAIGLLTCPARLLSSGPALALGADEHAIAAAYYAAPSIEPGTFIGVSLFSFLPGAGTATIVKALTLKMLRARRQRGLAQWSNKSLRVHTRMGVLRLEGPVPASHAKAAESFVYAVDLSDERAWSVAMRGEWKPEPGAPSDAWVPVAELPRLQELLERARGGERIEVLPPGLSEDGARVRIRAWNSPP